MSFDTFGEFLAMGGHGLYVWLSYGAAFIMLLYHVVSVRVRLRRFLQDARDRQRREALAGTGRVPGSARIASGDSTEHA